ncbi:MAG TPA: GNAT family N-acetyltransferase [Anaerolineales bacterium]|nr:GNAT family N-acetyltransferase [Anaerolineales bacterium]
MNKTITTTRGAVLIRGAKLADAAQLRELLLEALQDSPIAFAADYERAVSHPAQYWEDRLKMDADEANLFFAEYEDRLIGMTGIERSRSSKTRHSAWIWGVYVTPAWRGLRVAEELVSASLAWAEAKEIVVVKLGVASTNVPAIRCYERSGFVIYGTEPRAIFYEGKYYDEYLMSRSLDETTTRH